MKKYEMTSNYKIFLGKKLFQIRALVDLCNGVKAGELGGYIEKEENLSQSGNAWVGGDAYVTDNARVTGNALVTDNARVTDNALVTDNARVTDKAWVTDNAYVTGDARVTGNAWVGGDARVTDKAWVTDNAYVTGDARVTGNAWVGDKANINSNADLLRITGLGSVHRATIVYRTQEDGIEIVCGCFRGNLEQFREQVIKTREGKVRDEYLKFAELIEIYFRL